MTTYLIGIENKLLFEITDVKKINIHEDLDIVEFYNREKQLIFACNKINMDFLAKWDEGAELPQSIKKIYDVPTEQAEEGTPITEPGEGTDTPSVETPSENPTEEPSEENSNSTPE